MERRSISAWVCALAFAALAGATPALAVPPAAPQNAPLPTWQAGGRVSALAIANGIVYLGGSFTQLESHGTRRMMTRMHLAAINEKTGVPTAWNPVANGNVQVIRVIGKRVYVGGSFTSIGGRNVRNIAAIGRGSGRVVAGFRASVNGTVDALAASANTLYVGGSFSAVDGRARGNLGAVALGSGAINTSWRVTANGTVHTLLDAHSLKRIFIGGKFTRIDAVSRTDLGAVGQKLGLLRTWASAPLGEVWSLALGGSSALYAAVGGHEGGQLDSFNPGSGALRWNRFADGDVQAVSTSGNIVFAGGHFLNACATNQGGGKPWVCAQPVAQNRFFATDTSGALLPWNPDGNSLYGVWSLRSDVGHIVAGGDFTIVDGVHQARFAEFLR
jgi:hypothetical protein